jgi:hypothetical protein
VSVDGHDGHHDDSWLRQAMQLVLADLGGETPALVLTVIAWRDGDLVQLTVSSRAPGRLYRKVLDAAEVVGRDNGKPRRPS